MTTTDQSTISDTKNLSESRMAYIASEISLILEGSPDRTHFDDEEKTKVTHLAWDCLVDNEDLKLLVCLWKSGAIVLYEQDGYTFNAVIAQRLIGLAAIQGLTWDVYPLDPENDYEEKPVENTHKGVLH